MYNMPENKVLNFLEILCGALNFLGKVIYNNVKNKGSTFLGILCGGRVNRPARPVKKPLPPFAPTTRMLFACARSLTL